MPQHPDHRKRAAPAQAILYSPHGIRAGDTTPLLTAAPALQTLALLHGKQDVRLGGVGQVNLGAENARAVVRHLRARYWVGTHDEVKTGTGLVAWILRRRVPDGGVRMGIGVEDRDCRGCLVTAGGGEIVEVENGETLVLD